MMSVLERIRPEVRLKTGWLIPAVIGFGTTLFFSGHVGDPISQSDRVGMGALGLAGILAGMLWQLYSPREIAERLAGPALAAVLITVVLMLPIGEASGGAAAANYSYLYPVGVIAGLVLATRWQQLRAED